MTERPSSTRIEGCRVCGGSRLRSFLNLGTLPLSDGFLSEDQLAFPEPRFPLEVALCLDCALVQNLDTVDSRFRFGSDYRYLSSVTGSLVSLAKANVVERIRDRRLGPDSFVVEVASNDGYLLRHYADRAIPVLGIDPAPRPVAAAIANGIPTRQAFFGREVAESLAAEGIQADVIHANNVLAHVADTVGFVAGIETLLAPDGVAVIEVPYLRDLVDSCAFDTIYHEHLCYFSVTALDYLFRRHRLFLNRVESLDVHGGSLRLHVEKRPREHADTMAYLEAEAETGIRQPEYFSDFGDRVGQVCSRLSALLSSLKQDGATVVGYGAAAKGTMLLNAAGIGPETLDWVADRNQEKQGCWIPGVRIPIVRPERIQETQPDFVLILPWNHRVEILSQLEGYRKRGGRFIIPIPDPIVVE